MIEALQRYSERSLSVPGLRNLLDNFRSSLKIVQGPGTTRIMISFVSTQKNLDRTVQNTAVSTVMCWASVHRQFTSRLGRVLLCIILKYVAQSICSRSNVGINLNEHVSFFV